MTLPSERTRAVQQLEAAVQRLRRHAFGRTEAARVSRAEILELLHWLRHYPTAFDLAESAKALPDVWGKPDMK